MQESGETVAIANVRAVSSGLTLICEVDGRRIAVPTYEIGWTSQVRRAGDVGTLEVARDLAEWLGFAGPARSRPETSAGAGDGAG